MVLRPRLYFHTDAHPRLGEKVRFRGRTPQFRRKLQFSLGTGDASLDLSHYHRGLLSIKGNRALSAVLRNSSMIDEIPTHVTFGEIGFVDLINFLGVLRDHGSQNRRANSSTLRDLHIMNG